MRSLRLSKGRPEKQVCPPPWPWLLSALLLGFVLGLMYTRQSSTPGQTPPPVAAPQPSAPVAAPPPVAEVKEKPPEKEKPAEKPPEAQAPAPRFEFYEVLPSGQAREPSLSAPSAAVQPSAGTAAETPAPEPAAAPPMAAETPLPPGQSMLQVAAFQNIRDAEALKAQLVALGAQALVQQAVVNGVHWYRVRLGPFADAGLLEQARGELRRHGFEAIQVK